MSPPLSSTKSASLHPVLQTVLGNLDVQLEVELALYRCHQAVRRLPPLTRHTSQAQTGQTSDQASSKQTESTVTQLPKTLDLNPNNSLGSDFRDSNSDLTVARDQAVSLVEQTSLPLTLEAYLEFSQAHWQKPKTKAFETRFLQILKPLAIGAVSLLLSIPLSYFVISMIINHSTGLNDGIGSETCPVTDEAPKHFCNSSSVGDR